jgi:hypothetical protein
MRFLTLISIIFFSYNVNAQTCPFCGVPSGFSITTTDTQADITWNNVSNALFYVLRYQEDDGNNGIGNNNWIYIDDIYTNSTILTSLNPDTEYEFEVRSYCSTGFSYWSDDEEFETLNAISYDCAGVANGSAFLDICGDCVGGNTTLNACTQDCNGDYGGSAFLDNCNDCVGGNTTLNACTQDCNGDYGGSAFLDNCNDCVGGNTTLTECTQDCNGDYGGSAFLDNCNDCVGGNTTLNACTQDCNGDYGGSAFLDNCNDCVGGNTTLNACTQDCNGDYGGSAFLDNCNDCVGGNTTLNACTQDCNGDYGGNANIDDCGNCTIPSENCIAFSPNTSTSLSNTNCGELVDLSIMFEQDPYEPDIQNSLFWSDAGSFVFQNLNVGDTIGYGYLNTDGGNIMISTIFIINSFVTSNQIVINSIDTAANNNVGNFTIANLNPGIYITATSPGDNNNVTDGNYSMGVFQNIFLNPSSPTAIEFTANTNSELGDSDMQYESINIDCFSEIQTNATLETSIYPNPNNGSFNVLSSHESNFFLIAANGQVIYEKKLEKGSNFLNVDLRSGLYLIQIESEKENFAQKISVY